MLALIQRVRSARVEIAGATAGEIGPGLLAFLGIEREDGSAEAERLLRKVLAYRLFADEQAKMNLSLADTGGALLLVSQFTLAADTGKGLRPTFSSAKSPAEAEVLYDHCLTLARALHGAGRVACGRFGADMQVSLINDGPVTFLLRG